MMDHLSIYRKIYALALGLLLMPQGASATDHWVSIVKAEPVSATVPLTLIADVSDSPDRKVTSLAGRNYRLSILVPGGTVFDLSLGSSVPVTLPTIHHRNAQAKVSSISKTKIELMLANQVQLLDGQRLRVTLPAKPIHLYRIPFQAVYSPRGITAEVFVLSSDQRVNLVPIVPLRVLSNGNVIVSSDQLKGATIVMQGTDNLVSGDKVQIIEQKEAQL
jgi:multidrug efflux pump subunit AcrA (membrane-fusion protein)